MIYDFRRLGLAHHKLAICEARPGRKSSVEYPASGLQAVRRKSPLRLLPCGTAVLAILLFVPGGCKNRQITTPTVQMDIDGPLWVRVLLRDDVNSCTVKTTAPFSVLDGQTNLQTQIVRARFEQSGIPVDIRLTNGAIEIAGHIFTDEQIVILPDEPHTFNLDGSDYRGKLKLILNAGRTSFDVVNLIPPEPYLAGVVGAEMPSYWEPEALKAQAIAARTYCFYVKRRFGVNRDWDMKQTAAHQVYRGMGAESAQIWEAVNQTRGRVLTCKQADGTE